MKIVRATSDSAVDLDVRLRRPEVTVFDLATALHPTSSSAPPPPSLLVDGISAPGDLTLEEAGVHDGSIVSDPGHPPALPRAVSGGLLELVVIAGVDAGKRFALDPGSHVIGRGEQCDVRLTSPTVSRRQCCIDVDPSGAIEVHHLSGTVPTHVDGSQVEIAREFGFNDYIRTTEVDFTPALDYWKATAGFWAQVRQRWAAHLDKAPGVHLKTKLDGMAMIIPLFEQAEAVQGGAAVDTAKIDAVFVQFVEPAP